MGVYHEVTAWTRGIIMDKEARDVANCIATAAKSAGFNSHYIADYVDDPDRTNCLIRKYARFGDRPIEDHFVYENEHPDWVALIEETLVKGVNFFRGTRHGEGVVCINSAREPEHLMRFLPDSMLKKLRKLIVVDAVRLAEQRGSSPWMFIRDLGELAYDRMSTEGALERSHVGFGVAAPMLGALTVSTGVLSPEGVADTVHDKEAFWRGANDHRVLEYSQEEAAKVVAP